MPQLPSGWAIESEAPATLPQGWSMEAAPAAKAATPTTSIRTNVTPLHMGSPITPVAPVKSVGSSPKIGLPPDVPTQTGTSTSTSVTPLYMGEHPPSGVTITGAGGTSSPSIQLPPDSQVEKTPLGHKVTSVIRLYNGPSPASVDSTQYRNSSPSIQLPPEDTPNKPANLPIGTHVETHITHLYNDRNGASQPLPEYIVSSPKISLPPDVAEHIPQAAQSINTPNHAVEVSKANLTIPPKPLPSSTMQAIADYSPHKVTVSIPDKRVIVQDASGKVVRTYSAFLGKPSDPTPEGQFRIIGDDKPNPKGSEWYYGGHFLPFKQQPDPKTGAISDFGFHGWKYTKEDDDYEKDEPGWKTNTHGCVQLSNEDIADFAKLVVAGDPVTIINHSWKGK